MIISMTKKYCTSRLGEDYDNAENEIAEYKKRELADMFAADPSTATSTAGVKAQTLQ